MARRGHGEAQLDEPRVDVGIATTGYVRWGLIGWGCLLAFVAYLYVVSELLPEPGVLRTLAHVVGVGLVVLGAYASLRALRSGLALESEQARTAREELARLRRAPVPAPDPVRVVKLPLVVEARPKVVDDRAKSPVTLLVAGVMIAFLAWDMSGELGWSFLLTFAGIVAVLAAVVGLAYAANSRGRITVDEVRVRVRTVLRTRQVPRSALVDAVQLTMVIDVPRGPDSFVTSVHVTREGGRHAFSMHSHVYDASGVDAVLGTLGLPLRQVPGVHDPVGVEAFVPGSTSLAQRRPFTLGVAIAGGLIAACVIVVIAWVAYDEWGERRDASGGSDRRNRASSVYLDQTLTVSGASGSIYRQVPGLGEPEDRMLLFGLDVLDAHPERGCRLRGAGTDTTSCTLPVTEGFARRARELSTSSGDVLVSRSDASESHAVTLLEFRQEGPARVLALSVVDDGGAPYGLEVVFLDQEVLEDSFRPVVDDIRCTGRPDTSVHVATRFDTCG